MNRSMPLGAAPGVLALVLGLLAPARDAHAAPRTEPFVAEHVVEEGVVPKFDLARLSAPARRCGWWDNPTPGNVTFTDRDGDWTVALQAAYEAAGDGPQFARDQEAPRGASHTHGCVCMQARVDRASMFVYSFTDMQPQPLKSCRADPKLKHREPTPR